VRVEDVLAGLLEVVFESSTSCDAENVATPVVGLPPGHQPVEMATLEAGARQRGNDPAQEVQWQIEKALCSFELLLQTIAALARRDQAPRAETEVLLPQLVENGWQIADAARRFGSASGTPMLMAGSHEQGAPLVRHA
jgi:hypothetical protein